MKNAKSLNTEFLIKEESRLLALIDRLEGIHMMKGNRARAQKSLQCVQAELNRRNV